MTPQKAMVTRRVALLSLVATGISVAAGGAVTAASHPRVLVTPGDREPLREKIARFAWAKTAYARLKQNVDHYATLCDKEPAFLTSRLLMNWQTHAIQPIVDKGRFVRAEGRAPIPTPRFAGARDWATPWHLPSDLEGFRPFNDAPDGSGKVWLVNGATGKGEWTDPAPTGRNIEVGNQRLMEFAADAAFVFFLEGGERYARMGGDLLWTFLNGFQYVQLPRELTGKPNQIIGFTSFEVIHEGILPPMGLTYDFLYDALARQGRDVSLLQTQIKRMADRVIDGGSAEGNWNLNQADKFAYPTLALEDDLAYLDRKGRQYYVNILLNARLPAQKGIVHVIREGYDPRTALWPEAAGYGFGTTPQMIEFATLVEKDPAGKALLQDPFLTRAILAQRELLYPNGYAVCLGDTNSTRISTRALELLIASARRRGDRDLEDRLTAALLREIETGHYDRNRQSGIPALTQYVGELRTVDAGAGAQDRTYFGTPLNVLLQRNMGNGGTDHALAAALYGTQGGHVHANGLAIELYGAGLIQGADPGRGASYWTADHHDYYSQPVAHNTVIVNGVSTYAENKKPQQAMTVEHIEPESGLPALSPNVSFVTAAFHYGTPKAEQQRTLALIRTGPKSGFYFDVFRSRADTEPGSFHDYIYHNLGQSFTMDYSWIWESSINKTPPRLTPNKELSDPALAKGYRYFTNERSIRVGDWHGTFLCRLPDESERCMGLWMPHSGNPEQKTLAERKVFVLDAPADHTIRDVLPNSYGTMPMPTVLVRQQGEAWQRPFVTIYEPFVGKGKQTIQGVSGLSGALFPAVPDNGVSEPEALSGLAGCSVGGEEDGHRYNITLLQDAAPTNRHHLEGLSFQGSFGLKRTDDYPVKDVKNTNRVGEELYLVNGQMLGEERGTFISALSDNKPVTARLWYEPGNSAIWHVSANTPIRAGMVFSATFLVGSVTYSLTVQDSASKPVIVADIRTTYLAGGDSLRGGVQVIVDLPAGNDMRLSLSESPFTTPPKAP